MCVGQVQHGEQWQITVVRGAKVRPNWNKSVVYFKVFTSSNWWSKSSSRLEQIRQLCMASDSTDMYEMGRSFTQKMVDKHCWICFKVVYYPCRILDIRPTTELRLCCFPGVCKQRWRRFSSIVWHIYIICVLSSWNLQQIYLISILSSWNLQYIYLNLYF